MLGSRRSRQGPRTEPAASAGVESRKEELGKPDRTDRRLADVDAREGHAVGSVAT
jgi:hypothetical protein